VGGGDRAHRVEFKRIQKKYGSPVIGGITSSPLHQRGDLLVQKLIRGGFGNNNSILRPGLPFADRVRAQHGVWNFAGTRISIP